jgi:hypothetical protein
MSSAKFFLLVAILSAFPTSCFAQQALSSPLGTRSMVVNVVDARGNAARDLTKESFRLRLNGKPAAVLDAQYSLAPHRVVVLLDISGSMTGEEATKKWRVAREAARDLLAETPSDMPIALLTFSVTVRDVFDFSQGRSAITKWLNEGPGQRPKLKYPARTALFDAILAGLRLLQPIQPGDSVYVITDSGDNASRASASQTKKALLQAGVRAFAFLLDERLMTPREQGSKLSFLSMVEDSGGSVSAVSGRQQEWSWDSDYVDNDASRETIRSDTKLLKNQINELWTLQIATALSTKKSKVKLEVVSHDGVVRKDVAVNYCRILPAAK